MDAFLLLIGLAALVGGGDLLVRGATALARRAGVSPLVVGMTVVAFGTSAPELAVNVTAALEGVPSLSFGNVFGSNLANLGLVLGVAALVRPLAVHRSVVTAELPVMLVATSAAPVLVFVTLDEEGAGFGRVEGVLLLAGFAVFLVASARRALADRADHFAREAASEVERAAPRSAAVAAVVFLLGLAGVLLGGHATVTGAADLARRLGVDEGLIGLTVVAVGTSLPEMVTSSMAALRGESDLALGNVVGSNVFNLLFILGATASIRPVPLPAGGGWDLAAVVLASFALVPMCAGKRRRIGRGVGLALLAFYAAFLAWRW